MENEREKMKIIIDKHDEITKTIIIGIIAVEFNAPMKAGWVTDAARGIMEVIKTRGYVPQISAVNRLKNGDMV